MKITPEFIVTFETQIQGLITGNWDRVQKNLMWDRLMKQRPSQAKHEILTWLLETAAIYPEGQGGNKRFDDMVATTMSFDNAHSGAGLRLTKDEIEDNQMKDNPSVGALDYASKWAKDIGAASAYEPQKQLFKLILSGTTATAYDGRPFFDTAHPINPNGGGGTYSNHIASVPLLVTSGTTAADNLLLGRANLNTALASVRAQRFVNGIPRFLVPRTLCVQTAYADLANMIVNAGVISATTNLSGANPTKDEQKLDVIPCPELDGETAGTYYIGVEDMLSDELGAFVWSERDAYEMQTYGPMTEAALSRQRMFEWLLDGRNTTLFGHPYLFYRCKPGA